MHHIHSAVTAIILLSGFFPTVSIVLAQDQPVESDYYSIVPLPIPEQAYLEVGAIDLADDGRLYVTSRRGEIWTVENPFAGADALDTVTFQRFAYGLHEVLGIDERDGAMFVVQRGEVTRLMDVDGDGQADVFQTFNDDWEIGGDYHEYAFGSKFDREGNMWVVLCLTGSFSSQYAYRGWCLRITPDGQSIPTCSGLRSPGGIGMNTAGDMFYTDNQGPWNGTCSLKHLEPGKFMGHPAGNTWYDLTDAIGPRPIEPNSGSRFVVEADRIPQYLPPAVLFPYQKMGQSASGIACDTTDGKFGPFRGQMFVGDQTHSTVMRVFLEKINGHYQGACFPFRSGFGSGTLALHMTSPGAMFVGGTNRGWGSRGGKPYALERLEWTGETPFEIHEMKALSDGFLLTFTHPVDPLTAGDPAAYRLPTYTYIYQSSYGSPEVDHTTATITAAEVGEDRLSVRLTVDGLQRGHVHELHAEGVRSQAGLPLLHPEAYYTLNAIPEEDVAEQ